MSAKQSIAFVANARGQVRLFFAALCLLFVLPVLNGCTSNLASTEVENELEFAMVDGTAATGWASVYAPWQISDTAGTVLVQGTTDSAGNLGQWLSQEEASEIKLPVLLTVEDPAGPMFSLVTDDVHIRNRGVVSGRRMLEQGDTLFSLINPVTNAIVTRIFAGVDPRNGFVPPSPATLDSVRQLVVNQLFGPGFAWPEFVSNPEYRPAVPGSEVYAPSNEDLLIHTLGEVARQNNLTLTQLLDSLVGISEEEGLLGSQYQFELSLTLALFSLTDDDNTPLFESLGMTDDEVMELLAMAESLQAGADSTGNALPGPYAEQLREMVVRSVGVAMKDLFTRYRGAELDTAKAQRQWASVLINEVIIHELVPLRDQMQQQLPPEDLELFIASIAEDAVTILESFKPSIWRENEGPIFDLIINLVHDRVTSTFSLDSLYSDPEGDYFEQNFRPWEPEDPQGEIEAYMQQNPEYEIEDPFYVPPPPPPPE